MKSKFIEIEEREYIGLNNALQGLNDNICILHANLRTIYGSLEEMESNAKESVKKEPFTTMTVDEKLSSATYTLKKTMIKGAVYTLC